MKLPENIRIAEKIPAVLNACLKRPAYSSIYILCDSNTLQHCAPKLIPAVPCLQDAEIIETDPGEESKSLEVLALILQTLTEYGADKKALLINLGGGVISDLGGFAASIYKRGIDHVNIPTSLLAMADASVGGKNGINFAGIKNQLGTISAPVQTFIVTDFLATLPARHLRNGLAEIIKIALISDRNLVGKLRGSAEPSLDVIRRSVELKHRIVKKDPFDKGIRRILNFGHTFGHALESLAMDSGKDLLHGEAIAAGMMIESILSFQKKRIPATELETIRQLIKKNFVLPAVSSHSTERLFHYLSQDKKHDRQLRFALLRKVGACDPNVAVTTAQARKALETYNNQFAGGAASL